MILVANQLISDMQLDMAMLRTVLNTRASGLKPLLNAIPPVGDSTDTRIFAG
jgi:hypothetical protein